MEEAEISSRRQDFQDLPAGESSWKKLETPAGEGSETGA